MEIKFGGDGLVPVIAFDVDTRTPLMLAYANKEAIERTQSTGLAHYYSRSRDKLWQKGESSSNIQKLVGIRVDCDGDSVLYMVKQTGVACHSGRYSCFGDGLMEDVFGKLYKKIINRKQNPIEGSYTNYLFGEGLDKILKKVGEECAEVIIASKNSKDELIYELGDLLYHILVLMANEGIGLEVLEDELTKRMK